MADNVAVTPGTGAIIATDDVGGIQYQIVKLDVGGDGLSSPVTSIATETTLNHIFDLLNSGAPLVTIQGNQNHDGALGDSFAPVLTGGRASSIAQADVSTDGDMVAAWFLRNGAQATTSVPTTSGGLLIGKKISANSTNATNLKASIGQVYAIYAHNTNAAVRYLKLYNKASSPTVGSDTPVITFPIPGSTSGNGAILDTGGMGIEFTTGISYALTTGVADADTGAVAADEIVLTILYK